MATVSVKAARLPLLGQRPPAIWKVRAADSSVVDRLQSEGGFSPLVARVMAARGYESAEAAADFLEPALAKAHDPLTLGPMASALERIAKAIDSEEAIWIFGDYDVDGITATAILKTTFEFLGVSVRTYIPHRLTEGYGLSVVAIEKIAKQGAGLIITVDNGISAIEEIEAAAGLGIDVIVTDHHQPGPVLPGACAVLNPHLSDANYPFLDLAGVGVSFKLCHAILKDRGVEPERARPFLRSLLDLVALGTVADSVPLTGENRIFVAHGMNVLRTTTRPGLRSLMDLMNLDAKSLKAGNLAFSFAPRLNAPGRTDRAEYALELLLATQPSEARELAILLDQMNDERRRIEADITDEALAMVEEEKDDPVLVLAQDGWHQGVVGIVASRLIERYYRPSIVLSVEDDWAKGSARSIKGFDMHAALEHCQEHLERFGGHKMAAGLRLKTDRLDEFREAIHDYARSILQPEDLAPKVHLDATVDSADITLESVEQLSMLEPFGMANPKPLVAIEDLQLVEEPQVLKGKHLKMRLVAPDGRSFWAIGFSMGDRVSELNHRGGTLRLAANPFINRWGGRKKLELELKDFQVEIKGGVNGTP